MSLDTLVLLMTVVVIGFGWYINYLLTQISSLTDQLKSAADMIMSMGRELENKGSPNVKVSKD